MKLAIIPVIAATLGVAACNPQQQITQVQHVESQIQLAVLAGCGVEPTIASIAGFLSHNPYVTSAITIADLICAAVQPRLAGAYGKHGVPAPVVVRGSIIRFQPSHLANRYRVIGK
jgi:hypothetical protein